MPVKPPAPTWYFATSRHSAGHAGRQLTLGTPHLGRAEWPVPPPNSPPGTISRWQICPCQWGPPTFPPPFPPLNSCPLSLHTKLKPRRNRKGCCGNPQFPVPPGASRPCLFPLATRRRNLTACWWVPFGPDEHENLQGGRHALSVGARTLGPAPPQPATKEMAVRFLYMGGGGPHPPALARGHPRARGSDSHPTSRPANCSNGDCGGLFPHSERARKLERQTFRLPARAPRRLNPGNPPPNPHTFPPPAGLPNTKNVGPPNLCRFCWPRMPFEDSTPSSPPTMCIPCPRVTQLSFLTTITNPTPKPHRVPPAKSHSVPPRAADLPVAGPQTTTLWAVGALSGPIGT